jgi:predicted RNA-binding Zn ribbon-like protein
MRTHPALDSQAAGEFDLIAGNVCLDFTNTLGGHRGDQTEEYMTSYADLVRWARQSSLISATETNDLMRLAQRNAGEVVRARAVALREAIYRIVMAHLSQTVPNADDVTTLNTELAHALAHQTVAYTSDGFAWQWSSEEVTLDEILWRVARAAADLLLSPMLHSVRQCASDTCGWLFIDSTRNHQRRWCDMRGCGNRDKVRRHRARQRMMQST